nr:hypothetical protein [Tanacetum cinerariifolium]
MSNINNNIQTQTSNSLHNAIMEAGSKDRPPMLAPGNYIQWKSRIKRYIDTKPNRELIHYCLENPPYELGWNDKFIIDAEGNPTTATHQIDNDIYSTVDACSNACEMWKTIKRLKQGESINVQDLETNLFWEFRKFTSLDEESLESYYSRFYKLMNELTRNKCKVTNHQVNVQFLLQLQPEWQRFVTLKIYKPTNNNLRTSSNTSRANQDNSPRIHRNAGYEGQRSGTVAGARDTVGSSMVKKSGIQCYNCKEHGHVARECQKPKKEKDAAYHREKMLLCKQEEAGIQLNAEQADWRDDTDDESDDQELEAHYMYMAKLQQVSPDVDDSGPIFDKEPEQKVQNDDHYDVFAIDCQHSEQSESVHNTYLIEQDAQNVLIESENINYDSEQINQNDEDVDLAKECGLLASLIAKLKCEIDETKNHNTLLETSNKVLVEKLKSEIADFKNKNKSLTEANNKLSEKPKRAKDAAYHREKMLLCKQEEARIQLNAKQADWKDDTDDESD